MKTFVLLTVITALAGFYLETNRTIESAFDDPMYGWYCH